MKQKLWFALLLLLAVMQISISSLPVSVIPQQGAFYIFRIFIQILLLAAIGLFGYFYLVGRRCKKFNEYFSALEGSVNSLTNNLMKISAGDLSSGISDQDFFSQRFSGSEAGISNVGKVIDQSITELNAITATPLKRLSFTGGNSYLEGFLMGEQVQKHMNNSGVLLIVIPYFSQVLHALRAKGCISYLQQHNSGIKILPVIEGHGSENYTSEIVDKQLSKNKDISGIYITDGVTPEYTEVILQKHGLDSSFSLFAHDITESNINMLKGKFLKCLLAENFFAQSYNAIMNLYNSLEANWKPVSYKIYMDPLLVTRENYHEYWDSEKKDRILTQTEQLSLVDPVEHKSSTKWHLSVIMPVTTSFFTMAAKGANAAKSRLEEMGLKVDIFDAFKDWNNFATKASMEPEIREAVNSGIHGMSTVVFDRDLVPMLNDIIDSGITVTTFNSEPLNLRDIVLNISDNINTIQENSESLAASAEESARANDQVVKGMNSIENSTSLQNEKLVSADESFSSLNEMIKNISTIINNYTKAVEEMNVEAGKGVEQVSQSMSSFLELKNSFKKIDNELNQLHGEMGRIRKIVSTIDSFSTDTNVLAINASIQAARAGEQGKAFAVVAKEIRSLSEKSSQATEEISRIIDSVLSGVSGVVSFSTENMKQVEVNSERFSQVDTAFHVINQHLIDSTDSIRNIHSSIANAVGSSNDIKETLNQISEGNKGNLESIKQISESLRELASQSSELSDMASRYLELAGTQEKVISQLTY